MGTTNLALMFTDLVGSTELYQRVGDEAAVQAVHEHFEALERSVRKHQGELVKTMGDAVMAVFEQPEDALKAAIEIQREGAQGTGLRVRIGLHFGHCHVLQAAGVRDYFGTAVNLAARVEALGQAGEILLTSSMLAHPGVAALVAAHSVRSQRFTAVLKGFDGRFELVRIEFAARVESADVAAELPTDVAAEVTADLGPEGYELPDSDLQLFVDDLFALDARPGPYSLGQCLLSAPPGYTESDGIERQMLATG